MRIHLAVAALFLAAVLAPGGSAQEPKKEDARQEMVSRSFTVEKTRLEAVLSALRALFGTDNVKSSPQVDMIVVRTQRELMSSVEEIIKRMEAKPGPKSLEFVGYIIEATQAAGPEANIPAELESTVKQLKGIFAYKGYRVLETVVLRTREGSGAQTQGAIDEKGRPYTLSLSASSVTPGPKGASISLRDIFLRMRFPVAGEPRQGTQQVEIRTGLDVREGQKVVVGNTALEGPSRAVILVLTARVVD